ncbi:N-acetyltransferase [Paracoccus suum]|uniref:N-acetyltransferase n=1 Tax=Paracoccus suum TaxID=2259340 RepID=A0A344PNQ0_9RHOB|nr:N-acetyltransferase [Paracoccus suum]
MSQSPADPTRPIDETVVGFTPPPAPGDDAVIEGRTVRLERLNAARHAADIHAAAHGADWIWDYLGYGPFRSEAEYRAWMEGVEAGRDPCFYAFVDKASGRALGLGSLMRVDVPNGVIEVGHIMITPAMQRTTAASEAIMLMVGWAFRNGYRRVEWKCDALNAPSRAAADRYGFSPEGVFRQHMIIKGRNRDTAWFAMTDRDWPAIRARWDAWLAPSNFDAEGRQREPLMGRDRQAG